MIKCVAIDDEPIALNIIREYCQHYGDIDIMCFTSPIAGMECIKSTDPDIVFLDIEMNSHNGLILAKELPASTCLIFTTAYSEYALEAFNVNAVDYLHKPIFYSRFEKAMEKAKRYMNPTEKSAAQIETITLRADYKNVVISLKDIILVEAMDNYVKIFRKDKPTIIPQITMKEIEGMLPQEEFVRIHRSFIIAVKQIERFSNRTLYLHNFPRPIPSGRKYINTYKNLTQHLR